MTLKELLLEAAEGKIKLFYYKEEQEKLDKVYEYFYNTSGSVYRYCGGDCVISDYTKIAVLLKDKLLKQRPHELHMQLAWLGEEGEYTEYNQLKLEGIYLVDIVGIVLYRIKEDTENNIFEREIIEIILFEEDDYDNN